MQHGTIQKQPGQELPAQEVREVTIAGKFLGLGIVGCTVIYCIFLEKFGTPEAQANMLWYLFGALAAGIIIPLLLCRRPLR
ncbi:MAG: hypothetical protein K5Q68_22385 [Roseococcus sp.]|nr:hypothetical protein [Roseococcus sp.]